MAQPRQDECLTMTTQEIYMPENHPPQRIPLARAKRDTDQDVARAMSYEERTGSYPSMLSELALFQNLRS
jgi:hypothetical protein